MLYRLIYTYNSQKGISCTQKARVQTYCSLWMITQYQIILQGIVKQRQIIHAGTMESVGACPHISIAAYAHVDSMDIDVKMVHLIFIFIISSLKHVGVLWLVRLSTPPPYRQLQTWIFHQYCPAEAKGSKWHFESKWVRAVITFSSRYTMLCVIFQVPGHFIPEIWGFEKGSMYMFT